MRLTGKIVAAACSALAVSALCLGGCSSQSSQSSQASYDNSQTFTLGESWEITTTNEEVVYSESDGSDVLRLYLTVKNTSSEEANYYGTANVWAYQNGETIDDGEKVKAEGTTDLITAMQSQSTLSIAGNSSIDAVYCFALKDYSDVTVSFGGYTSAVEKTEITCTVEGKQTEEGQAKVDAAADIAAMTEVDCTHFSVKVPDGFSVESYEDDEATLVSDEKSSRKLYISVSSSFGKTVKEKAQEQAKAFKDASISKAKVSGTTWQIVDAGTMGVAFAAAADDKIIKVTGNMIKASELESLLKSVTVK